MNEHTRRSAKRQALSNHRDTRSIPVTRKVVQCIQQSLGGVLEHIHEEECLSDTKDTHNKHWILLNKLAAEERPHIKPLMVKAPMVRLGIASTIPAVPRDGCSSQ